MQYKLTLPADFFESQLTSKLLASIVKELRPLGVELHFDIVGLSLSITKNSEDIPPTEIVDILGKVKVAFDKHYTK